MASVDRTFINGEGAFQTGLWFFLFWGRVEESLLVGNMNSGLGQGQARPPPSYTAVCKLAW